VLTVGSPKTTLEKTIAENRLMIRITTLAEADAATESLVQAFAEDPLLAYLLPDAASRSRRAFHCLGAVVRYGLLFGEVYATSPNMEGVAVWLPPEESNPSFRKMLRAGVARLPITAGVRCTWRFWKLECHLSAVWDRHGRMPHWYLALLGVLPAAQGCGHGGQLVSAMLRRFGEQRLPCCVDTANSKNVPFYERFGFTLVERAPLPGTEVGYWFLRREQKT
jgi:ribosomal protein S18 acetylase RimI-like enzyme